MANEDLLLKEALLQDQARTQTQLQEIPKNLGVRGPSLEPLRARSVIIGKKAELTSQLRNFRRQQDKTISELVFKSGIQDVRRRALFESDLRNKINQVGTRLQQAAQQVAQRAAEQKLDQTKKHALASTISGIGATLGGILGIFGGPPAIAIGAAGGGLLGGVVGKLFGKKKK